jgi:hypothetical protein
LGTLVGVKTADLASLKGDHQTSGVASLDTREGADDRSLILITTVSENQQALPPRSAD